MVASVCKMPGLLFQKWVQVIEQIVWTLHSSENALLYMNVNVVQDMLADMSTNELQ